MSTNNLLVFFTPWLCGLEPFPSWQKEEPVGDLREKWRLYRSSHWKPSVGKQCIGSLQVVIYYIFPNIQQYTYWCSNFKVKEDIYTYIMYTYILIYTWICMYMRTHVHIHICAYTCIYVSEYISTLHIYTLYILYIIYAHFISIYLSE